jgi:transcriptional regulator with XRE-family HTH domain
MLENVPTERVAVALRFLKAEGKQTDQRIADSVGMSQSSVHRRLSEETPMTLDDLKVLASALGHNVVISFFPKAPNAHASEATPPAVSAARVPSSPVLDAPAGVEGGGTSASAA